MKTLTFLLALGCAATSSAQTRILFDLAGSGTRGQTVDPGNYEVVIRSLLPSAQYDITITRELIPIDVLSAEGLGRLQGFERGPEAASACSALMEAVAQLLGSTTEAEVPSRARVVSDRLSAGTCTDADVQSRARAALDATTRTLAAVSLAGGERLIIRIVRAAEGVDKTWTLTLETQPRGKWITTWGLSFLPDGDEKYFAKSAGDQRFVVTAEREERGLKLLPSVFFSWLSTKQQRGDWAFSPTAGFGVGASSAALFGGISVTYNHNISFIGGVAITGQQRLSGRYEPGQEIAENLSADQLQQRVFRPSPFGAITFRFARNPFNEDETKQGDGQKPAPGDDTRAGEDTKAAPAPAATPAPGGATDVVTEAAVLDPDIRLRFDAKGAILPESQSALASLATRATTATDVFVLSHGWWNDVSTADCFYRRIIGGLQQQRPGYLTPERFRPVFVTIYWPSAVFPLEKGDCDNGAGGRTEASGSSPLGASEIRRWATGAFPDAAGTPTFAADLEMVSGLLQKEQSAPLTDAEGTALASILVRWHEAAGAGTVPDDSPQREAFAGNAAQIAAAWARQPETQREASQPGWATKWVGFGNAFTFWSMKQRAGVVGSRGVFDVLASLQAARAKGVRIHLIGHSFGGKVLSASLTGHGRSTPNRVASFVVLQGAFSHFAYATRDQITQLGVNVGGSGLYADVVLHDLVSGPLVVTFSTADVPNRVLYPVGVSIVNDVLESARAPRFASVGASGIRGPTAVPLNLASASLRAIDPAPRRVNVDASGVIFGHSDLLKPQVFALIWDALELASAR